MPEFHELSPTQSAFQPVGQNARVAITLRKGLSWLTGKNGEKPANDINLVFYTVATPLYCSVDYMILKGGENLEELPEAALYIMSFAASTMVDDLVLFDEGQMFPDKTTQQWKFYNRAKTEFACCTAMMSFIRAIVTSRSTRAGRKILADFSIDTGAMSNLFQASSGYLRDLTEQCKYWKSVLFSGGAFDHEHPVPTSAVKGGNNPGDSAVGIGRGWYSEYPLNVRERPTKSGNTYSRPSRYSSPRHYTTLQSVWWE